ncbi:deoxyribodipyrimidine photo-lyase, partial [Bowmanella yangjiangensis]|uniref:deoxyribodipyrimidine photo-lyase n=1 Tax=Bowmanella yangjiangensis TaxID=2811230 RepID=UPI002FCDD13E
MSGAAADRRPRHSHPSRRPERTAVGQRSAGRPRLAAAPRPARLARGNPMQRLMWLRTDLRTQDNTALSEAMLSGPTIALYLITPQQWQRHDDAP